MNRTRLLIPSILISLLLGCAVFMYSGVYNIAADEAHWGITTQLLETLRSRSIARRARDLQPPNLDDTQRVLNGAGQYAEMCVTCHLAPGVADSVLRQGLYPQPPDLSKVRIEPRSAFWVVKHGIKMTGMPAWGASHDDDTLWSIVAFVEKLPQMSPEQYKNLVSKAPPDTEMSMPNISGAHSDGAVREHGHSMPHRHKK